MCAFDSSTRADSEFERAASLASEAMDRPMLSHRVNALLGHADRIVGTPLEHFSPGDIGTIKTVYFALGMFLDRQKA